MKIRLSDYTEQWIQKYTDEKKALEAVFQDEIIRFEHFGSTSVVGMKAKPVIDMMCIVKDIQKIDSFNNKMTALGYDVAGEWGIVGRRLFRKGGENRTHHIHFYQFDHPEIERHLVFRDYLRTHPEEAKQYSSFKEQLSLQFEHTRDYSPAKKAYVAEMESRALKWHNSKKYNQKQLNENSHH